MGLGYATPHWALFSCVARIREAPRYVKGFLELQVVPIELNIFSAAGHLFSQCIEECDSVPQVAFA